MLFSHDSLGFLHFYGIYWLSYYDNGINMSYHLSSVLWFGFYVFNFVISWKKNKQKSALKHQLKSDSQLYKSIQLNGQYSVSIIHMHDKLYIIIAWVTNLFFITRQTHDIQDLYFWINSMHNYTHLGRNIHQYNYDSIRHCNLTGQY